MSRITLSEDVYLELKNRIVSYTLPPGTPLSEEALAEEFNVSRTPIREALRMLEAENLVEIQQRRGTRVASISRKDVLDAYEIREWIEPIAAAKVARDIDDVTLAKLEDIFQQMPPDPKAHDEASKALEADQDFHNVIIAAVGNRLLSALIKEARAITSRAAYFVPPGRYNQSYLEHDEILQAFRERDVEKVEMLMRKHIQNARNRMVGETVK